MKAVDPAGNRFDLVTLRKGEKLLLTYFQGSAEDVITKAYRLSEPDIKNRAIARLPKSGFLFEKPTGWEERTDTLGPGVLESLDQLEFNAPQLVSTVRAYAVLRAYDFPMKKIIDEVVNDSVEQGLTIIGDSDIDFPGRSIHLITWAPYKIGKYGMMRRESSYFELGGRTVSVTLVATPEDFEALREQVRLLILSVKE